MNNFEKKVRESFSLVKQDMTSVKETITGMQESIKSLQQLAEEIKGNQFALHRMITQLRIRQSRQATEPRTSYTVQHDDQRAHPELATFTA